MKHLRDREGEEKSMQSRGLKVNAKTTKMMVTSENVGRKFTCAISRKDVGIDYILCI